MIIRVCVGAASSYVFQKFGHNLTRIGLLQSDSKTFYPVQVDRSEYGTTAIVANL